MASDTGGEVNGTGHLRLVSEIPPNVVRLLKNRALWRCHTIIPVCYGEPYAEVSESDDDEPIRHLFCHRCTVWYCERHGIPLRSAAGSDSPE